MRQEQKMKREIQSEITWKRKEERNIKLWTVWVVLLMLITCRWTFYWIQNTTHILARINLRYENKKKNKRNDIHKTEPNTLHRTHQVRIHNVSQFDVGNWNEPKYVCVQERERGRERESDEKRRQGKMTDGKTKKKRKKKKKNFSRIECAYQSDLF